MITGAASMDGAIIVVAASDGQMLDPTNQYPAAAAKC